MLETDDTLPERTTVEVSVVIPCLNEADTLGACVRKAQLAFEHCAAHGEVIVADNGSTDGSQEIARLLGARVVNVFARGYGHALKGGIAAARGTFVIMGDADASYDFPMAEVALATSAAPTYFEPAKLAVPGAPTDYFALIDGGVFAVNPGMCAWAEARALGLPDDTVVLSLGTGSLIRRIPYDEAKDWGLIQWAQPILDVVFDGSSDTVDYQLGQVIGEERRFRLQTTLETASDDMDDASEENLRNLRLEGENLIERESAQLDAVVELLV